MITVVDILALVTVAHLIVLCAKFEIGWVALICHFIKDLFLILVMFYKSNIHILFQINVGFNLISDQDGHVGPPEYDYFAITCADHDQQFRGCSNLIRTIIFLALDCEKCSFNSWISFKSLSCLIYIKHPFSTFCDQVSAKSIFVNNVVT